ncbi:MAG: hypothetical protein R6T96_03995, partial [Longimicrobiales bacterium]
EHPAAFFFSQLAQFYPPFNYLAAQFIEIGMSIAYAASFLGMALAWYGWRKRRGEEEEES